MQKLSLIVILLLTPVISLAQETTTAGTSNNRNSWSNSIVPNCQQAIQTQVNSRFNNSTVNFTGKPTKAPGGSNVIVNGRARVRASNSRSGNIDYQCTMQQDGKVVDSKFDLMGGGNLTQGTPVR